MRVSTHIVKFTDDEAWEHVGNLQKNRYGHSSVLFGSFIIVIGGTDSSIFRVMPTELWDIEPIKHISTRLINPILEGMNEDYVYGGLFLLNPYYCKASGKS